MVTGYIQVVAKDEECREDVTIKKQHMGSLGGARVIELLCILLVVRIT